MSANALAALDLDERLKDNKAYTPPSQSKMVYGISPSAKVISATIITPDLLYGGRFVGIIFRPSKGREVVDKETINHLRSIDDYMVIAQGIFDGRSDFGFKEPFLVVLRHNFHMGKSSIWVPGRYRGFKQYDDYKLLDDEDPNKEVLKNLQNEYPLGVIFTKYVYDHEQKLFREKVVGKLDKPKFGYFKGDVSFGI